MRRCNVELHLPKSLSNCLEISINLKFIRIEMVDCIYWTWIEVSHACATPSPTSQMPLKHTNKNENSDIVWTSRCTHRPLSDWLFSILHLFVGYGQRFHGQIVPLAFNSAIAVQTEYIRPLLPKIDIGAIIARPTPTIKVIEPPACSNRFCSVLAVSLNQTKYIVIFRKNTEVRRALRALYTIPHISYQVHYWYI